MQRDARPDKVEAIYALREAAERKAVAEHVVDIDGSPETRDALLAARLVLEERTQDAIESCLTCGHEHGPDEPHPAQRRVEARHDNVVDVDFRHGGENLA